MASALKDSLAGRITGLQERRQLIVTKAQAEVAHIDQQLTALQSLYSQWDTLTIEQGLAALAQAGMTIKAD